MTDWTDSHVLGSVTSRCYDTLRNVTRTLNQDGLVALSADVNLNISALGAILVLFTSVAAISLSLFVGV
jgi:hypothetical protein